jgi:hypothetical protein
MFCSFGCFPSLAALLSFHRSSDLELLVAARGTNVTMDEKARGYKVKVPGMKRGVVSFPFKTVSAGTARFQFAVSAKGEFLCALLFFKACYLIHLLNYDRCCCASVVCQAFLTPANLSCASSPLLLLRLSPPMVYASFRLHCDSVVVTLFLSSFLSFLLCLQVTLQRRKL